MTTDLVPSFDQKLDGPSLSLLAALESIGGVADDTGLYLPPDLPYDQYVSIGALLTFADNMIDWYIADWLNHGEHVYGHKFHQAAEITGKAPQTLMNMQAAARMVPPQRRRTKTVDFWKHYELRMLSPNDQRHVLKRAEEEHLTKTQVRKIVQEKKGMDPPPERGVCGECGRPYG